MPALIVSLLGLQVALAIFALSAKEATTVAPPLAIEWVRRLIAGVLLLLVGLVARKRIRPSRSDLADALIPGLLGFAIGRGCVMVALSMTSATNVAVIDSAAPAVALVLAVLTRRERAGPFALLGSVTAFAGVGALVLSGRGLGSPTIGDVIASGSPLAWGTIYVWMARRAPDPATLLRRTAWFSLAGAAGLALPAVAPNPSAVTLVLDARVLPVLALGVAIGVAENAVTFRAIGSLGAVAAAEFEYLVPCLTAVFGLTLFSQPVLPAQLVAIALVAGGLLVAGRSRWRHSPQEILPGQPCCVT